MLSACRFRGALYDPSMIPFKTLMYGLTVLGFGILLGVGGGLLARGLLTGPGARDLAPLVGGGLGMAVGAFWLIRAWAPR